MCTVQVQQPKIPLLPGQANVTQAEFEALALAQVNELWTEYGDLGEIWFDGGYGGDMAASIKALLRNQASGAERLLPLRNQTVARVRSCSRATRARTRGPRARAWDQACVRPHHQSC